MQKLCQYPFMLMMLFNMSVHGGMAILGREIYSLRVILLVLVSNPSLQKLGLIIQTRVWPVRLAVRTPASHAGNMGSIPIQVI